MPRVRQGVYSRSVYAAVLQRPLPPVRLSPSGRSAFRPYGRRKDASFLPLSALRDDRRRDESRRQTGKILLAPLRTAVLEALGEHCVPGGGAYLFLPTVRPDSDRHGSKRPANRLLQRRLPHTVVFRASEADTIGRYDKKRVRTDELCSDSFCIYNNVIYRNDRRLDEAARVC
jgi:hypothetical protein